MNAHDRQHRYEIYKQCHFIEIIGCGSNICRKMSPPSSFFIVTEIILSGILFHCEYSMEYIGYFTSTDHDACNYAGGIVVL